MPGPPLAFVRARVAAASLADFKSLPEIKAAARMSHRMAAPLLCSAGAGRCHELREAAFLHAKWAGRCYSGPGRWSCHGQNAGVWSPAHGSVRAEDPSRRLEICFKCLQSAAKKCVAFAELGKKQSRQNFTFCMTRSRYV